VVEDKPTKVAVQLSYLTKEIIPSPETERTIYGNATTFAGENQKAEKFLEAGKKLNIKTVQALKKDEFSVPGLGSTRELVKWAFNAKKGEVSPPFTTSGKHVIALLENITPKGLPDLDAVRDRITPDVKTAKKFELLAKKVDDAKAATIDALATKLGKASMDANGVSFGNPAFNNTYEPTVTATALSTAAGKLSGAIKGNSGVFVVQTVSVTEPAKQTEYGIYTYQTKQQLQQKATRVQEVQKKLASITDDRSEFF